MRSLALILIAACGGSPTTEVAAPATPRVEDSMAGAGAVRLAFHVIPGSEPALLLEAGGGADSSSWGALPEQLAAATGHRVISYDRAGFGHSPFPPQGFTIADELAALHAGVHQVGATRIVPVAASYGALIDVAYAASYPADVAGFVFLDPMNAAFVDAVGVARVLATVPSNPSPSSDRERAIARMTAIFPSLIAHLHGAQWTANLPVVIVSAATPPFPDADLQAAWRASHETLAKVPGATRILAEHSDHDIAGTEPAVVVSAVQRVLGGS
ncbi:MAG: alpha/beta fold hydrolase [Myxococcales bacterium]|nr:alpha/beta fold hydrolase [Myxococcales bacterium]